MKEVLELFVSHDITFIEAMEELAEKGYCPNLLNDDNGHWAVAFDGYQTVPTMSDDGRDDIQSSFYVEKDYWFKSIEEALIYSLNQNL